MNSRNSGGRRDSRNYEHGRGRGPSSQSHGGWFGDSEGHSKAASGRSSDYDEDYEDRNNSDYDHRGSNSRMHDEEGRFTSSRGGSNRDYDYDDNDRSYNGRGHGGWFGDSEGHSRAASSRNRDYDGNYDYDNRSGYDEDDYEMNESNGRGNQRRDSQGRFSSSGRDSSGGSNSGYSNRSSSHSTRGNSSREGERGWFGHSRAHAEAAKEGWRHREN